MSDRRGFSVSGRGADPEAPSGPRTPLDRTAFRRDPLLRSSAHHLAIWSLAVLVLDLRNCAGAASGGAPMFVVVAVLAGAILTSLTHERRISKMLGPAPDPPGRPTAGVCRVTAMLATVVLCLVGTSVSNCALAPLWMAVVGTGLLVWGRAVGFSPYVALGVMLALLAGADVWINRNEASVMLRVIALGMLVPAGAMLVIRRWLSKAPAPAAGGLA